MLFLLAVKLCSYPWRPSVFDEQESTAFVRKDGTRPCVQDGSGGGGGKGGDALGRARGWGCIEGERCAEPRRRAGTLL